MAVNLTAKSAKELPVIDGIQIYVGQAGIKYENKNDITLMVLAPSAQVAGVFTRNRFCAAPVHVCKEHLQAKQGVRAIIINTGNANAGTGQHGRDDAKNICTAVAQQICCDANQVLPFSTGVILEPLPASKIITALSKVKPVHWDVAASAIMTTDTVPKAATRQITVDGKKISVTGIAKGAGMIRPNMATMLSFIATDADIEAETLSRWVKEIADKSFNCVTVDGDTSTNDSFIIIATGKSGLQQINDDNTEQAIAVKNALSEVALELATAIVRDGEGATKFITIQVNAAKTQEEARKIGYTIAHSPLVKTAFFASDANLGRLLCAIGNSGIEDLDTDKIAMFLDNVLVAENGGRAELYKEEDGARIMKKEEITVRVELQRGNERASIYTCDLSHDYVSINADYRS
ncbi:MAG: bifunctional glutamate N-acetyltransferase/amino-acid acetyltransferase ArgJ [Neisseriaceae bacterium]|nr:bifunctional glutamate N-acetyltransferase/amino-acid acetyltransferase ArgJ [Neisseriaceae bacterium]